MIENNKICNNYDRMLSVQFNVRNAGNLTRALNNSVFKCCCFKEFKEEMEKDPLLTNYSVVMLNVTECRIDELEMMRKMFAQLDDVLNIRDDLKLMLAVRKRDREWIGKFFPLLKSTDILFS